MTLLVPGCKMLSIPSHLLPLLLDGWESREYLWLPLSKDQVWVRNSCAPPPIDVAHVILEHGEE